MLNLSGLSCRTLLLKIDLRRIQKSRRVVNGIVSLLDDKHYELVENLWAELGREFGLKGIYITPFPHFSYQVAEHYEVELLESVLQRFALKSAKFKVKTTGLGIFTTAQPCFSFQLFVAQR